MAIFITGYLGGTIWTFVIFVETGAAIHFFRKGYEFTNLIPPQIVTTYALGAYLLGLLVILLIAFLYERDKDDAVDSEGIKALALHESKRFIDTPRYGPRVRICKIFTDLPLEQDKPVEFGVNEYCKRCKLCGEHCEAEAISMDDEPSHRMACRSNNQGALKWHVNVERCYLYWCENGIDCSTCIKVCPYNVTSAGGPGVSSKEFWE